MKKIIVRPVPAMILVLLAMAFRAAPACNGSRIASPVTDLSSVDQLKQRIQQDSGKVRLIALLSPI